MEHWKPMCYISDTNDLVLNVKRQININGHDEPLLSAAEINAACNATIILSRMVRQGRKAMWDNIKRSRRP
jgi:hypothetical protein